MSCVVLFVMLRMEEMVVVVVLCFEDELRGKTVITHVFLCVSTAK